MFLATFLIGLREGLEAALIVAILATFLKRNGQPLKQLNIATILAIALSIAVGVGLMLFSQALPQAQQEGMEAIIDIIAVVFVSTMIIWMKHNARLMKTNLEGQAREALEKGRFAFAVMAFLSVIKEGFETAVFLLAILQSSGAASQMGQGLAGAVVGILLAALIGFLIYFGGSRFNAGLFFKITGPFLVLVAAGFSAEIFRKAHEAGWVNIAQQQVFDFSGLINGHPVLGALLTGMFGIEADPRLIEVIAYFAYLIPFMVVYLWPQSHAFTLRQRRATKLAFAGICAAAALVMFVAVPRIPTDVAGSTRTVELSDGTAAEVTLVSHTSDEAVLEVPAEDGGTTQVTLQHVSDGNLDGAPLTQWETTVQMEVDSSLPTEDVTLNDLLQLNGGKRLPSGISKERTPGPFSIEWEETVRYSARTSETSLLRAQSSPTLRGTLTGGGIDGSKVVNFTSSSVYEWSVSSDETSAAEKLVGDAAVQANERSFWWAWCPIGLGGTAVCLAASALWDVRKERKGTGAPDGGAQAAAAAA